MTTNVTAHGSSKAGGTALGPERDGGDHQVWQRALPTMADSGEVDLLGIVRTVYRRKVLLLLTMAATMAATLYWLSQVTPEYSADVLIVIESRPSSIVKVDQAVQDVSADAAKVNTEVAVLESRGLAARVIFDLELDQDPEFAPAAASDGLLTKLEPKALLAAVSPVLDTVLSLIPAIEASDQDPAGGQDPAAGSGEVVAGIELPSAEEAQLAALRAAVAGPSAAAERAALLDRFLGHLTVVPEDASRLVRIGFRSTDPAKAERIANKLVDEYLESQLETKSEGARRAAEWLEVRLGELGDIVRSLEQEVQRQRAESGSNAIDIVSQTLAQLNTELVAAQAAAAATKARYEQAQGVLEGGGNVEALPSIIASGSIQALRARHTELYGRLSELQTSHGEQHPTILSIRAEMADLERRRGLEIDNILAGLHNEVRSADIHEARLREELEAVSAKMVRLNEAEASIGQVAQRLQANRDLYQNLLKRHTEAVALRENQQPDARIISPAQIPLRPSYPNLPRVLALAFIGSASLSAFLLVMVERFRQKLDTTEDAERHIGLPVIGAIPDLPRLWRMKSAPSDYMQREPLSEFGSAFQRLRALLVLGNDRKMPKRVLVTSATAGEGKTTTAVCLGVACVASGQRVLLIDCDFGRPHLHEMVDVPNEKGLTDIVKGTATLDEAIVHANGYSLSILTIGRSREGAIDLLNYGRMEDFLAEIKGDYDTIILDSAPVLEVSNALILGGLVEKTLLVTRRDWTSRRKASDAAGQLQLYGADIAGLVFNRTGPASS